MKRAKTEALVELQDAIEDLFYAASLLRTVGDVAAAMRLGDIGDKLHDEYLRIARQKEAS
jgi:hypothetical protein